MSSTRADIDDEIDLDKPALQAPRYPIASNSFMKVITQKQLTLAIDYVAEMLKRDGAIQTQTVQEWLDAAQFHPAQYQSSLPALEILGLLGFGNEMVQAKDLG
jgi:hypothetical protein